MVDKYQLPTENSRNMAAKYQPQQKTHATWLTNINPNRELTSPEYNGPAKNNLSNCIVAQNLSDIILMLNVITCTLCQC